MNLCRQGALPMKQLVATLSAALSRFLSSVAFMLVALQAAAAGEKCESRSTAARVAVLELYTSQGCNSCPPAHRWVRAPPPPGFTPHRLIPLVFHFDYWDPLCWPDRLAKAP